MNFKRRSDLNRILAGMLAAAVAVTAAVVLRPVQTVFANEEGSPAHTSFFDESNYRVLKERAIKPKKLSINLRRLAGEDDSGYSVVQGSCTDGTYAYYLMVSSTTQKGRVLKLRIKDNKVVARSKVLNTWHGNGMAYDSRRKKLVVIAREQRKQEITLIDAKSLKITRQENVKYSYYKNAGSDSISKSHQSKGLAAIAYVRKYDVYIALEREVHDFLIFDPDSFEAVGMVRTQINTQYPGTFQGMDADEKYVYLLLSPYYSGKKVQPYNLILAFDWNSEMLLPIALGQKDEKWQPVRYIQKRWYCGNSFNGQPDAAIRLSTKYEAESIYHTKGKNGKGHFYLAEYKGSLKTKTVTLKNSKGKKYKKKITYWGRDGYVYDLGVI